MTTDLIESLRQFDTPTIANAIELFDVRPHTQGYMDHRIRACFPKMKPMVGYAFTAHFRSAAQPQSGSVYTTVSEHIKAFADLPGPAVMVFQDLDSPSAAATFGEVMCATYKAFGAAGLITSGSGRDLDQVEAIDFPVFTAGTNCSHGYAHITASGEPVHVGGLSVDTGNLLHGDLNGVVQIPDEITDALPEATAAYVEAEHGMLEFLRTTSNPSMADYEDQRKQLGERIGALRKKFSRA